MQRLKNSTPELDQLKDLLLADELTQLKELASKLRSLDFEAQDEETILQRITPLFDRILLERLKSKDAHTQEILSQYFADIIAQTSKHNPSGLSRSLQSVISPAIAKEIAENKDVMIDALYPIMGGMISKYVTQAIKEIMETINKKIENGLSIERVKRKVKAKMTGVSEAELMLEEGGDARILSLFVIDKETSLLIAEAYLEDQKIDDAHMVASMASAIKDFINDWIKKSDTIKEVQLLSYGNETLYIESAGTVYIIAFLDSEPDHGLRKDINIFFASLLKQYAAFFQAYDGDDSAVEVNTLSAQMLDYLNTQSTVDKIEKKNPVKYLFYAVVTLFLGYGIYLLNEWYFEYSLEKRIYTQTEEHISIDKKNATLVLDGQVSSIERIDEIIKIANQGSDLSIHNHLLVPMLYLDERLKNAHELERDSIVKIDKKFELLEGKIKGLAEQNILLEKKLKDGKRTLLKILEVKKLIAEHLDTVFKDNAFYNTQDKTLDFGQLKFFEAGTSVYAKEAIAIFEKTFEKYLDVLKDYKEYIDAIVIEGHSDSSGSEEENFELSKKRALVVKDFVEQLKSVKQYSMTSLIKTKAFGSSQAIVAADGIEDKERSRRIKITFELSSEQIVKILREVLHD